MKYGSGLLYRFILLSFILFSLVGCSFDHLKWFETKEAAITFGLQQENIDRSAVLSVEEYNGETIIFFEINHALGVASIAESSKGYSWYRSEPFVGLESDSSYSTMGFDMTTHSGLAGSILAGKAFAPNFQKLTLLGDGDERELTVSDKSRFFYTIHETPFHMLKVVP